MKEKCLGPYTLEHTRPRLAHGSQASDGLVSTGEGDHSGILNVLGFFLSYFYFFIFFLFSSYYFFFLHSRRVPVFLKIKKIFSIIIQEKRIEIWKNHFLFFFFFLN